MAEQKFHFSPRPNRAAEIDWREWGEDAFQQSRDTNKPILLSLSAVWCHWCHVMDETTYSDEGVITFINQHFVPVRVDNDERPDINARYNMGGWPTTAFLTPEGETLAGATYIAPDQMKEVLPKVYTHFVSNRDEITQKAIELREQRADVYKAEAGELSDDIFRDILRSTMNHYDPLYGGFGEAPKFPHTDALDLLLYAHRRTGDPDPLHMARKTLEMMFAGDVYDREWNGFFRYATRRDWSEPHYEKMLEDEAGLLRNALALYRISNQAEHREIAEGIIAYVDWKLRDREHGYFYGSQDADEEFYKLDAAGRDGLEEPYIDRRCYTSWNAEMISAYLEASWTLDRPELAETALFALAFITGKLRVDGTMHRYLDASGSPAVPGWIADQSRTALSMLDAYEVTGDSSHLDGARAMAALLLDQFEDKESGGFWDVAENQGLGRLQERQKSVQENAVVAQVLFRLSHLTREPAYGAALKRALESFVLLYRQMGYFAAGYAAAVDSYLHPPLEINIVGAASAVERLHQAALSLNQASRLVQVLDPARDAERLAALSLPVEPAPAAYVCSNNACSAPASDVDQLLAAVREMRETN